MPKPDLRDLEINAFLAQAERLATLFAHPAWEAWTSLLTDMRLAALEAMAACDEPGEFRYHQGVAAALAAILERPRRIVSEADAYQRAEQVDKNVVRPELRAIVGLGVDTDGDV